MVMLVLLLLLIYLLFYIGYRKVDKLVEKERSALGSQCNDLSGLIYTKDQILRLPAPVRRYFNVALKNAQPYISSVHIEHDGRYKSGINREWTNIEGEQHVTVDPPGFLWKGKTTLFTVKDSYLAGRGRNSVYMLNLIKVHHGAGPVYDQGELARWLGESVWVPTNLLPGPGLQWYPIDNESARLNFTYKGILISFTVRFNEKGEITQMETYRTMGKEGLTNWIVRLSCYEEKNGMKIPMEYEALWKLPEGEFSYVRFRVRNIQHY